MKVLVTTDLSPLSKKALQYALKMKKKLALSEIHVVTVLEKRSPYTLISHYESTGPNISEMHNRLRKFLGQNLKSVTPAAVEGSSITQAIEKYAKNKKIDMIFVSSHGYGASLSLILGSTAQKLIAKLKRPITIIR